MKERISVNVFKVYNEFYLVPLKYHGLYVQHPANPPYSHLYCQMLFLTSTAVPLYLFIY